MFRHSLRTTVAVSALISPLLLQSSHASAESGSANDGRWALPAKQPAASKPVATSALRSVFGSSPKSLFDYESDPSYRRIPPPPSFKKNHAIYENVLHESCVKKYNVYRSPTEIDKDTGEKKETDFEVIVADLEFGDKVRGRVVDGWWVGWRPFSS